MSTKAKSHPLSAYCPTTGVALCQLERACCEVRSLKGPLPGMKDSLGRQRVKGDDPAAAARVYRETHHLPGDWPVEVEVCDKSGNVVQTVQLPPRPAADEVTTTPNSDA